MRTEEKPSGSTLHITVMGSSQVGKSALAVRYLTKRFIGEYRSDSDMLYKCVLQLDGIPQPVEIMDTSASCDESSDAHLQWADAFVVVYSITDKDSFQWAVSTIQELSERRPSARVLLLGNKSDLGHLREVEEVEASTLALRYSTHFSELSTAESCEAVADALDSYLKEIKSQRHHSGMSSGNVSPKQRKLSVTRMLGSLIGRHSPPPQPITELIVLDKEERSKLVRCSRQI